jgi:hypothetical protein
MEKVSMDEWLLGAKGKEFKHYLTGVQYQAFSVKTHNQRLSSS